MIQEIYCSYNVAKLLKEKEFDEPCLHIYTSDKRLYNLSSTCYQTLFDEYIAPTQQIAMAWLRELKGLFIAINCDDLNYNWQVFDVQHRNEDGDPICKSESFGGYYNYEDAVEAALKYSLENLI